VAAHAQPFDAFLRAAIEGRQDRRPSRCEHRLGDEGRVDRVFGVFAVDDEPAVEAGLAHQRGEEIVEPVS